MAGEATIDGEEWQSKRIRQQTRSMTESTRNLSGRKFNYVKKRMKTRSKRWV